jgi:hypothetical protein
MEDQIIKLIPDVNQFKTIFFKNGQGSLFQNHITQRPVRIIIVLILVTVVFYLWGLKKPEHSWLVVMGLFFTIVGLIFLIIAANKFYSWKKQVNNYLNTISEIKTARLTLKQDSFELQTDERIVLQKLNSIKKIEIEHDLIRVYEETEHYYFPLKTMKADDFAQLVSYFRNRS